MWLAHALTAIKWLRHGQKGPAPENISASFVFLGATEKKIL